MLTRTIRHTVAAFAAALAFAGIAAGPAAAAEATTESATAVTTTSAQLNATLNPGGEAMIYAFEYGLSEESGTFTKYGVVEKGHFEALKVSATVSNLTPQNTYHFRIAAVSNAGTLKGSYLTFKTPKRLGLYVTEGDESGPAGFRALEYPVDVSFEPDQSDPPTISIGATTLDCADTEYLVASEGYGLVGEMQSPQASLTVIPVMDQCEFGELGAVDAGITDICGLELGPDSEGFPFGGLGLSCLFEGPGLVISDNTCEIVIATQSAPIIASVYENLGEGEGSKVTTGIASDVDYEASGAGCQGAVSGAAQIAGGGTLAAIG